MPFRKRKQGMDNFPNESDDEAFIESRRYCPADDKTAFVVVVAPEKWHDDRILAQLAESLKNEGIPHAIVKDSKMVEAQKSLGNERKKTKIENFIVVVIADGFYCDDGEALIFEDCYVLLDSFIHPVIALEENRRQYKNFILMSFHPRKYYEKHEQYFPINEIKTFLADKACHVMIETHLINAARFGKFSVDDEHVRSIDFNVKKRLLELQEKFINNEEFKKWIIFLCNVKHEKCEAIKKHRDNKNNENITWSHAKTNTMKLFFNDQDEKSRDLGIPENDKKFKIFTNFIKQMSKKNRQLNIKERV